MAILSLFDCIFEGICLLNLFHFDILYVNFSPGGCSAAYTHHNVKLCFIFMFGPDRKLVIHLAARDVMPISWSHLPSYVWWFGSTVSGSTWQLLIPRMRNWVLGACEPDTLYVWISEWYLDTYRRLGVEMSLSALTYFWQFFMNRTVQCGHIGREFLLSWESSKCVYCTSGGIINGFTCVKTYN